MKGAKARRAGKVCGVCDSDAILTEAREEAHRAGAQAEGGAQRKARRFTGEEIQFPGVIIGVVHITKAEIGRESQAERISVGELPVAHGCIVRADGREVKGYNFVC